MLLFEDGREASLTMLVLTKSGLDNGHNLILPSPPPVAIRSSLWLMARLQILRPEKSHILNNVVSIMQFPCYKLQGLRGP